MLIALSSGVLVILKVNLVSGDLECINIDRSLIGKLFSDKITDILLCDKFIAVTYTEPKLTVIHFTKQLATNYGENNEEKLSSIFSKIVHIDLYGPPVKRTERKLSINVHQNTLLVWWQSTSNEVWPWTPASTDRDRANVFVYTLVGSRIDLLCCLRQEAEPLIATFSKQHPDMILTVEEILSLAGDNSKETNVRVYEISHSKLNRVETTAAPIPGHMMKAVWNKAEDKVAIICKNGFLCSSFVSWHKDGAIISICDPKGHQQIFDIALNEIRIQLTSEESQVQKSIDLSSFFTHQYPVNSYLWSIGNLTEDNDGLFMSFESGPMVFLRFVNGVFGRNVDETKLLSQYIRNKLLTYAVNLLTCMNWNFTPEKCYSCTSRIINYLLRCPLTIENEALIETTLGTFYNLNHDIKEEIIFQFRDKMVAFARRFFHHLLRNDKVEKAFLLAVDINSADLFMDIFHFATNCGEDVLAETARTKAIEIQESFSKDSDSTSSQYSNSSGSSSESDNELDLSPLCVSLQPSRGPPASLVQQPCNQQMHKNYNYRCEQGSDFATSHSSGLSRPNGGRVLHHQAENSTNHSQRRTVTRGLGGSYPWQNETRTHDHVPRDIHITIETPSQSENEDNHAVSSNLTQYSTNISDINLPQFGNENDEDNEEPGTVRVIHFGVI
ncbi:WD repeat-containing and planar cell polarity effector protein fritz [Nymphon striatum]|nr:WD repeat-containing and planar cell polarity effector protein fritz [Nymphon striatum]